MSLPHRTTRRLRLVVTMALSDKTTVVATGRGESSQLTVLHGRLADPVDASIVADGGMGRIAKNNLEVLVGGILVNPIGVKDTQVTSTATNSLLSNRSQGSLELELGHTLAGGLSVGDTLGSLSLARASADTNSVDNVTLLGLVSKSASLIRASGVLNSVDGGQLSVLPASDSQQETKSIRLLLLPDFFQVFVGTWVWSSC